MARYNTAEIDGVPVFWGDGPPQTTGAVFFRVGQSDEHLLGRGTTHLIEHLALYPMSKSLTRFNGATGQVSTSFTASGESHEVGQHLTSVMGHLAALPHDRVEVESRVLRTEASQRSAGTYTTALAYRYGPNRFGNVAYEELGLLSPQQTFIDAWRNHYFTRQNAVCVFSGPPPESLRFTSLPDGEHRPVPVSVPLPQVLPARVWLNSAGVAISFVLPRSVATSAAMHILRSMLFERLRGELGISYDVGVVQDPWTEDSAHWLLYADCRPEVAGEVAGHMHTEFSKIGLYGVDQQHFSDYVATVRRAESEPYIGLSRAWSAAQSFLLERRLPDADADAVRFDGMTIDDVTRAASVAFRTGLWMVPYGCGFNDLRMTDVSNDSATRASGREFLPPPDRANPDKVRRLTVGPDGVSHEVGPAGVGSLSASTVLWASMVAAKRWADGWSFFGNDGFQVTVWPPDWAGSPELEQLLAGFVPSDRVVHSTDLLVPNP